MKVTPKNAADLQAALNKVGEGFADKALDLPPNTTCIVDKPLYINSGTAITGPKSFVLKLADDVDWTAGMSILDQKRSVISDILLKGFTIDCNRQGNPKTPSGKQFHTALYFERAKNVMINDMHVHDGQGDAFRFRDSNGITVTHNKIDLIGHDGLHCRNCSGIHAAWNDILQRVNSGIRVINAHDVLIEYNRIKAIPSMRTGGPGIQIDRFDDPAGPFKCNNIRVRNNDLLQTYGPGMWVSNYGVTSNRYELATGLVVSGNRFIECGQNSASKIDWVGGIIWNGWHDTIIRDNLFYGCYRTAVAAMTGNTVRGTHPNGTGYTLYAYDNAVLDTKKSAFENSTPNGIAFLNALPETHKIVCDGNYPWHSANGGYHKCEVGKSHRVGSTA